MTELKKRKVTRTRHTTYMFYPKDFCRSCGHLGIWEEDLDEPANWICLPCGNGTQYLREGHASRLVGAGDSQPEVTIHEEWEAEIDELQYQLEQNYSQLARSLALSMYGDGSRSIEWEGIPDDY